MPATNVLSTTASIDPSADTDEFAYSSGYGPSSASGVPEWVAFTSYATASSAAASLAASGRDPVAEQRAADVPDAANVPLYRRYAKGTHPRNLTAAQRTALEGLLRHDFSDNVCQQIISIAADRVEFERFDVAAPVRTDPETNQPLPDPLERYLDELRVKNRLDALQAEVAYAVFRDGNHYVAVDWKADSARSVTGGGRALWMHEPAWDGSTGMHLVYDERGVPAYAVKEWVAREGLPEFRGVAGAARRFIAGAEGGAGGTPPAADADDDGAATYYRWRTLYLPHEIRHYRLDGDAWVPYRHQRNVGSEAAPLFVAEPWPLPWTKNGLPGGEPLGIPVFHFANASRTGRPHGDSELSGGVLGVQDQINDAQWDLSSAGRYTGYQRTWSAGTPLRDENDDPVTLDIGPGAHAGFPEADARMGVIPAGDCSQLIAIIREKRDTACRMTATPAHLVTVGSNTTGEAILRAEAPLENKAKKVANKLAPAYSSAAHFSVVLANAKAGANLSEDVLIQAVMAPTSRRDPLAIAEQAQKVANLLDEASLLELLGYPPARITEIIANRVKEREAAAALLPPPSVDVIPETESSPEGA
jgi:hypothetical protein